MERAHVALGFAVLGLGVVACAGSDARMRPEVPSDVTTTTGAPTATSAQSAPAAPAEPLSLPTADNAAPDARPIGQSASPPAGAQSMTASPAESPPRKTAPVLTTFTDAEIVAVIDTEGRAERQLALEAMKRAQNARVRQIAERVLSDHQQAKLERVERIASLSPVDSATSADLKTTATRAAQRLEASSDQSFDGVYVDALAAEERQLIELLDGELIPQAQNEELRTLLQDLRTAASSRIAMAESAGAR
jgi:putative membrane protein